VFYNPGGFWDHLFELFESFVDHRLVPGSFSLCWSAVEAVDEILPAILAAPRDVHVPHQVAARS
jgi:predicted Rossmann-fold nucleotide-binding protein